MRGFRSKPRQRSELYAKMDVTPFVSIVLAILFLIFPITPPHHWRGVDLPVAEHGRNMPAALREEALVVKVTRDGRVFLGDRYVDVEELPEYVRRGASGGAEKRLYVWADARAKYGDVKRVLDEMGKSGVTDVSFVVEKVQP
jgi:biopolymer transport protein TolR